MAIGGDILIKLAADVAELRQGFDEARREAAKTQKSIAGIGDAFKGLIAKDIVEQIVGTLATMARNVGDIADKAASLQLTTREFQAIGDAAIKGGLGLDGFQAAFNKLNQEISNAADGNKAAIEKFKELDVHLLDQKGRLRDTGDVAAELAKKIGGLDDPNQRAGKSMDFFGRNGAKVLPIMEQLGAGANELADSLAKRGGIASPETIDKLNKFFSSIDSSKGVLQVQGATIFANLLPDGDKLTKMIEQFGNALVRISEIPWVKTGLGFIFEVLLKPIETAAQAIIALSDVVTNFGKIWEAASAIATEAVDGFMLKFLRGLRDVVEAARTTAEGWANAFLEAVNQVTEKLVNLDPDIKRLLGLVGITGGTKFDPIKIPFEVVGMGQVEDAIAKLEKAQQARAKALEDLNFARAAQSGAVTMPPDHDVAPRAGVRDPRVKPTGGGKAPKDRVAEMLDELVRRQSGEEHALAALKAASVETPLREIERQVDLQKKIDDMVAKVASKEPGGASSELVARITAQVTATENAAAKTKEYHEALKLAQDTEKQFGDGSVALAETMSKLNDAYSTGRLGLDAYNIASKTAKETADAQALAMRGALGGADALAAGFEAAAARYAKANDDFAIGGQIFDETISFMSQGLDQFVTTGQIQFDKLLASFVSMLAQMALRAAASQVFGLISGGFGGGGGGLFGGLFSGLFGPSGSGTQFAMGSTNDLVPGVGYTVGEFGPETFVPRVGGQILTADDMAKSWGGAPRVSQTINVSTGVVQTVRAEIASMLPQIAQAGAQAAKRERERGGTFKQSFR